MPALTEAELADARNMQAMAMQDELLIERYTGGSHYDEATDENVRDKATVYAGVGRAQAKPVQSRQTVSADELVVVSSYACAIPWDHTDLQVDDLVTVTTSADPALVGVLLRVVDVEASTFATARHFTCTRNLD